jgi:hypothetical protein
VKSPLFLVLTVLLCGFWMMPPAGASSHREAPLIAGDPQVDNTDVYVFRSPDAPDTVTFISNWIPFEDPAGGPNFYFFDPSARYDIRIDNNGDAREDIIFRFEFQNTYRSTNTFLYNTGVVTSLDDADLNFRQHCTMTMFRGATAVARAGPFVTAPSNVGVSTPAFGNLLGIQEAALPGGNARIFAGQVDDPFFLDLRVFDLLYGGDLSLVGTDTLAGFNVHAIAIQVPIAMVRGGTPIISVWSTAERRAMTVRTPGGETHSGDWVQVSRLGSPLVNEVVIPLRDKDKWNGSQPSGDAQFLSYVTDPELPRLLNLIYGLPVPPTPRADLVQVFLTGVAGLTARPGETPHEALRVNLDVGPTHPAGASRLGVLGGDPQGFPNGRRLADDVVDIELRAVAGALIGMANTLGDGVDVNDRAFGTTFPYLGLAWSGGNRINLTPRP